MSKTPQNQGGYLAVSSFGVGSIITYDPTTSNSSLYCGWSPISSTAFYGDTVRDCTPDRDEGMSPFLGDVGRNENATEELLSDPDAIASIRRGEADIAAGRTVAWRDVRRD